VPAGAAVSNAAPTGRYLMSEAAVLPAHELAPRPPEAGAAQPQHPLTVDEAIAIAQQEFPRAGIRITGRARTVRKQAELMADRRRKNRDQFIKTYLPARHITEMDHWVSANPHQTLAATVDAFERIIATARIAGARVSNHLGDMARDISIPLGGSKVEQAVRKRLEDMGCHVIDEHDATGGPHWHVDLVR